MECSGQPGATIAPCVMRLTVNEKTFELALDRGLSQSKGTFVVVMAQGDME